MSDLQTKTCTYCRRELPLTAFYKAKLGKYGRRSRCIACLSEIAKNYNKRPEVKARSLELSRTPEQRAKQREYAARPEVIARVAERAAQQIEVRRKQDRGEKRKARKNELRRARRITDPTFAAMNAMRGILHRCLSITASEKIASTVETLGYGPEKLRHRIECQFKPGMSWANRGLHGWHIDHKKPIAAFIQQGITDPKIINALCNLQPLWAAENHNKGASWPLVAANDNTPVRKAA